MTGVDYDDETSVLSVIPHTWWLEHVSCRYMLACLVHKDNKDVSCRPTKLPAGKSRSAIRKDSELALKEERAAAKLSRPVDTHGDMEYQMKKARVDGIKVYTKKIAVESIISQIAVMKDNEDLYKEMLVEHAYKTQLVGLLSELSGASDSGKTAQKGMVQTEEEIGNEEED